MKTLSNILGVLAVILALAILAVLGYTAFTLGYEIWSWWGDPFGLAGMLAGVFLVVLVLGIVVSSFVEEDSDED